MVKDNIAAVLSALESANIKEYEMVLEEVIHVYNNDNNFIINGGDIIYGVSRKSQVVGAVPFEGQTVVKAYDPDKVVYMSFAGDFQQIEDFLSAAGQTLTDEQKRILLKIDRTNYNVIPETGDYHPFKELTPEEYEALTPEEKAAYDAAKKENDAVKSGVHRGFAVRVEV